ncbi:PQQ-dependent sugar dehydrogenase [Streptomyces profundus]|uniref:PQQ-dependent sugar dehydrogenase n=1 Tax=Streptomyces profundus TaxID=2867410 RepID=UPI001D16C596|nr:PQQ-dependent sugar dehydrogenase [Streptomyces sp. MA3_2.13]UED85439.1 PQQ-dependent sugar dehydrogenase [Streptomyces sp. MA3_2.13]
MRGTRGTRRRGVIGAAMAGALVTPLLAGGQAAADPPAATAEGFAPLAVFDDYANGSLRSQGPWFVNTPGAPDGAVVSDEVPGSLSGKALTIFLSERDVPVQYRGNAYAELGELAVPAEAAGTVFLELVTEDLAATALNIGLSADESPGLGADTTGDPLDLDDFGPQVLLDERGLLARDGAEERLLDVDIEDGARYGLWLTVDNAADTFQVRVAEGDGAARPAQGPDGQTEFAFRSGSNAPLETFLLLNDPDEPPSGDTHLDSVHLAPTTVSTENPAPAYAEVVTFDDYQPAALDGQDGWRADPGVRVLADPTGPAGQGQVVELTGNDLAADRAVPPIAEGETGTVFFRFQRAGGLDASLGLTDVAAPTAFADFRVQANNQNSSDLGVRDGGAFTTVGSWPADAWQCVWLVADNATDRVTVHSRGGPYRTTTRLPVDERLDFAFRESTGDALDRFLAITGANSASRLLVDDLAVDQHSANLRVPSGDAADCQTVDNGELPIETPIPETPQPSDVTLQLAEVADLPSTGAGGTARINFVSELPDDSGRLAVPDLNGPLYLVDEAGGDHRVYLDAAAEFPDFVIQPSLGTGLGFVAFHPEFADNGTFYTVHTEAGAALDNATPTHTPPSDTRVHGVVTEWIADDPSADTFAGDRRELLRVGYSRFLHGLQEIGFNPLAAPGDADHGLLYIASGDGDEVPNFSTRPGDRGEPQGKILRIDPAGDNGPGGAYGIPADNPFVGDPEAIGEVYALGLRNPHRFSWDPADGRMFVGMIGEQTIDSVYEVEPGDDFGWNEREGGFLFRKSDPSNVYPLPEDDERYGYTYPVLSLGRNSGVSLVGGFVPRGATYPALDGRYLFGDIVSGEIRFAHADEMRRGGERAPFYRVGLVDEAGQATTMRELAGNNRVDLRFGQDAEGRLYLLSKANGKIWRVTDATGSPATPGCAIGDTVTGGVTDAEHWAPLTPERWAFENGEIIQTERGEEPAGPRRPFEYAVLTEGPEYASFSYAATVRIDEPVSRNDRDVVLIYNYHSPTRFSYVHLSQDNTIYPHNGIFVVDDADRLRLDDQWNGVDEGAPPAIDDDAWHDIRVDFCADTGRTAVYVDNAEEPLMTATDTTFTSGRLGFGSFDNHGRARDITVTGTPATD